MVLLLSESAQGYALFRLEKKKLEKASVEEINSAFENVESSARAVSLLKFVQFKDVKEATEETAALVEGKMGKILKKTLKKQFEKSPEESLSVWDKNLAACIKKKLGCNVVLSPAMHEIFRGIKTHFLELLAVDSDGADGTTAAANTTARAQQAAIMTASLSHSLSRFKLKFSPEKVDIMVIQAVGLLDDLDKELNNLAMRLKEWYGFHFPELLKIVPDNLVFAKLVMLMGLREDCKTLAEDTKKGRKLRELVGEEVEAQLRVAAETSMGSELVEEDLRNIKQLCQRVVELYDYRASLVDYLKKRMEVLAPNLTHIVGEVLGAKLLAQAGSLISLAKQPASTVQILGAEKALFRALKGKTATPKYGLIFHAQLVGQAVPKIKGKMSRILANKIALCARTDACAVAGTGVHAIGTGSTSTSAENNLEKGRDMATMPSVAIGAKVYCERRLTELLETANNGDFSASRRTASTPSYTPSTQRSAPKHFIGHDQQGLPSAKKVKVE